MTDQIRRYLSSTYPWTDHILYLPSINSTNECLKQMGSQGAPHGAALFAGFQHGGKGRLGRSFHSPEGMGIYMSMLLRPACTPVDLMHLTCAVAVAVCNAVEQAAGFRPGIKWTNDLVHEKKKLGGILTELKLARNGSVDFVIIGIGINCRQTQEDFPEDIQAIATSVDMVTGKENDPARLAAALLEELAKMDTQLLTAKDSILNQYRTDCITIGQQICVVRGDLVRHGQALTVDTEGALLVQYEDGTTESVNSGEVSIRGMYGYV